MESTRIEDTPMALSARALLRWQFRLAHRRLDASIMDLSAEKLNRCPMGAAATVGATYAYAVYGEDIGVNGLLAGTAPLLLSTWAGRAGLSALPSLSARPDESIWATTVRLDLSAFRPYAQAVFAATDAYLAALPDDALSLEDGDTPACMLSALLLTLATRRGEIACLLALDTDR